MNRRELLKPLGIVLVAWPITGQAQQVGKIYRIGFLANDPTIPMQAAGEAFLAGPASEAGRSDENDPDRTKVSAGCKFSGSRF
jgi:hypothetical protein